MVTTTCPVCGNTVSPADASCPSCGFKLLGSTQRFAPVAVESSRVAAPDPVQAKQGILRVVRGPQPEVTFRLPKRHLSVGRSPQCDIFLNDMTVSRNHASIEPCDDGYIVRDENSYNGVWVNNESIDSRKLVAGDVIQIGVFCLVYEEE